MHWIEILYEKVVSFGFNSDWGIWEKSWQCQWDRIKKTPTQWTSNAYQLISRQWDVKGINKHPWSLVAQSLRWRPWQHPCIQEHSEVTIFYSFCTAITISDHMVYIRSLRIVCYHAPFAWSTKEPGGKRPKCNTKLRNTLRIAQTPNILLWKGKRLLSKGYKSDHKRIVHSFVIVDFDIHRGRIQ